MTTTNTTHTLPAFAPPSLGAGTVDPELVASPEMMGAHQSESEVHGTCVGKFQRVQDAFLDLLTSGQDVGASVAVLVDGEVVVDLLGGYFDSTYTRRFPGDSLVNGFSLRRR